MSLSHLVEVYPELKGKSSSSSKSASTQFSEIVTEFSELKTQFGTLGALNHTNKHEANAIKSQLDQLKNKVLTIKGLPDADSSLKSECTRCTTDIGSLIRNIDSQVNAIPNV
jgi:hypothetical protein